MTKGKNLEGHFIWAFFWLPVYIYIYIHSASKKDPTENGLCKCEGGGWSVLPTRCILATGFARSDYLTTDRQTDITYLLLLPPKQNVVL